MSRPGRNADPDAILRPTRTFFVTSKTSIGRRLFQRERNAGLMIEVLRSLVAQRKLRLDDFVTMPDHVHLLITVNEGMTIEKAMQLIKGRFSHRLAHDFGFKGDIWQRGFSEVQVIGEESIKKHREYIAANPVRAGLVHNEESYPFCYQTLSGKKKAAQFVCATPQFAQGLKP